MRAYIKVINKGQPFSFNYQPQLTGTIHKWLGAANEWHGNKTLYSFSLIQNVRSTGNALIPTENAYLFFSAYNMEIVKKLVSGILTDPTMFSGMSASEVILRKEPEFISGQVFHCASPVFIKAKINGGDKHMLYTDEESGELLTKILAKKLESAGLNSAGFSINFCKNHPSARTKLLHYNQVANRASICPVEITGTPEQLAFAWNVGVGNCTGIGFGAII